MYVLCGMRNVALFDIFIFLLELTSLLLYIFGFVFNVWLFLFDLTSLLLYIFGFVLYNSDSYSIYFDICI